MTTGTRGNRCTKSDHRTSGGTLVGCVRYRSHKGACDLRIAFQAGLPRPCEPKKGTSNANVDA